MGSAQQLSTGGNATIRVLIVDNDSVLARSLQRILGLQGFVVDTALDGRTALNRLEASDYDVMLLDLQMGSMDGMEVFAASRDRSQPATIIHSAHIDVRTAVVATRAGVQDVMQKPVPEDVLAVRIRELAAQRQAAPAGRDSVVETVPAEDALRRLVGDSAPAHELREHVRRVAQFRDVPVLVQGSTGTGKELIAQAIHALTCPAEPFVSVNCAAVPEQLFESELFGHEAGAFTNARSPRVGLFEEAGRGTLFLDEIGEMPFALQAKLLRVLEIRQFRRVGGTRTRVFAARVVSATNRVLNSSLGGAMRPDLFFRLAGYAIKAPTLAERLTDVPLLARHFLKDFSRRHAVKNMHLSAEALDALTAHSWPGNVRELRAVVENASILARSSVIERTDVEMALQARRSSLQPQESWDGASAFSEAVEEPRPIPAASLPVSSLPPFAPNSLRRTVSLPDVQRDLILRAFEDSRHNLSKAALDLGIPRSTLRARLKRYGVR